VLDTPSDKDEDKDSKNNKLASLKDDEKKVK
jgi:hypothetical protein